MSKYLETKKGSIESAVLEAMSPAQQAAIAISKKEDEKNEEKTECPKCKGEGCDHCEGKGYHTTEELTAKQKKIDLNKNGKVDGDDLKKLRAKKNEEVDVDEEAIEEGFSPKQIKMAIGVASDKRYAGGNMSGAVSAIDKIKKGLSDHPQVAAVLKRQNESLAEKAARHISDMWKESAAAKDKKEDKKVKEDDDSHTTMTGKPAAKIVVNPKSKEEK